MTGSDPAGRLKARLRDLPAHLAAEANTALRRIGDDVVAAVRAELISRREGDGNLGASLTSGLDMDGRVVVTASHPAAAFLEYGTRTMTARPFLRPAVTIAEPAALDEAKAALLRAVSGLGGAP